MTTQLKKRLFDLLWAATAAAIAAAASVLIPGLKELLGDFLTNAFGPVTAALVVTLRNI